MGLYAGPCYRRLTEETFFKNLSSKTHTLQKPDPSYSSTVLPVRTKVFEFSARIIFWEKMRKQLQSFTLLKIAIVHPCQKMVICINSLLPDTLVQAIDVISKKKPYGLKHKACFWNLHIFFPFPVSFFFRNLIIFVCFFLNILHS